MKEIWKLWAKGYESYSGRHHTKKEVFDDIFISNMGNIRGRKTNLDSKGYLAFRYKGKSYRLHHEVALLFIPNPENKRCIDHINTDRLDNNVKNLRWCTHKENSNNINTRKKMSKNHANFKGSNNPRSRKVKCIETGDIFLCAKDASKKFNVNSNYISNAANYNKKACGYHWEYIS